MRSVSSCYVLLLLRLSLAHAAPPKKVVVGYFYSTQCPHCAAFLMNAMDQFIEARLSSDKVLLDITPLVPSQLPPAACASDSVCWNAIAPLCALNMTGGFVPRAADDPMTLRLGRFLVCDIANTYISPGPRSKGKVEDCANKAGIPWDGPLGLERCAFPPSHDGDNEQSLEEVTRSTPGLSLLEFAKMKQQFAMMQFQQQGFAQDTGIPWVFVDGHPLDCTETTCHALFKPAGDSVWEEPLAHPGSLLSVVCGRLQHVLEQDEMPDACPAEASDAVDVTSAENQAKPAGVKMKECKKCEEDAAKISKSVQFDGDDLATCPGESRKDGKCDHSSFRVCVQLLDSGGKPKILGDDMNWWQWSKQTDIQWDAAMRDAGGDSWCVCSLCIAEAITKFGCDHINIDCKATDGTFVMGAANIDPAYESLTSCVKQKCPDIATSPILPRLYSMDERSSHAIEERPFHLLAVAGVICVAALAAFLSVRHFLFAHTATAVPENDMESEAPLESEWSLWSEYMEPVE